MPLVKFADSLRYKYDGLARELYPNVLEGKWVINPKYQVIFALSFAFSFLRFDVRQHIVDLIITVFEKRQE